jgi:hypothetical protein
MPRLWEREARAAAECGGGAFGGSGGDDGADGRLRAAAVWAGAVHGDGVNQWRLDRVNAWYEPSNCDFGTHVDCGWASACDGKRKP